MAEREALLARYVDNELSLEERQAALAKANRLLEEVIGYNRRDPRAIEWRFDLVQSRLYQEAEPYYLGILYRGGTPAERRRLAELMEQTAGDLALLRAALEAEFQRLDSMAPGRYEELERGGYIDRLEAMQPKIAYLERWVRFYRAVARPDSEAVRTQELTEILRELRERSGLLETPHRESRVQAQSQLMAGIAGRLIRDFTAAAKDLQAAADTVRRIANKRDRAELTWVVNLALFELAKIHRDKGDLPEAWEALRTFESEILTDGPQAFGLQLSGALLAASLTDAEADAARAQGRTEESRRHQNRRFEPLMRLSRQGNAERDAVYKAVYDALPHKPDPAELHPFAGCALVAGLLSDAQRAADEAAGKQRAGEPVTSPAITAIEARRVGLLDRAIQAARHFHDQRDHVPPELRSEIAYGLAVAQFHRGKRLEAARGLLAVAWDDPRFRLAEHAASVAVQIATELAQDPSLRERPEVRELQLEAMKVLSTAFTESEQARYWQFFYAQALLEAGHYADAAAAFARVRPDHEFYVQAALLRVRSLAAALGARAADAADPAATSEAVEAVAGAVRDFETIAESAGSNGFEPAQIAAYSAEAEITGAEALLRLGRVKADEILSRLSGFEERYPGHGQLLGRVLRTRILAYELLDRWNEAEAAIPDYVQRDPKGAGATLQGLFDSIRREIDQLRQRGQDEEARRKSQSALLLARRIDQWAAAPGTPVAAAERYEVRLQLAEALLGAEQYDEAYRVFQQCSSAGGSDSRVLNGSAEALFHLKRYTEALPLFNRLTRESQPGDSLRYQALLRDLQCRTELNQSPEKIIQVIRQHKFLDSAMGGEKLRAQFDQLLARNEARLNR